MPAPSDILQFMRGQLFETPKLPQTTFAGKTIVITGANSGLGFECAKQVAHLKASTLVLGCRDLTKGRTARDQILASCANKHAPIIHVWPIDLSNYASVRAFASRMRAELERVDVLLANAGISTNEFALAEGLENTLTVNVVSTFLLSLLALPQLERTASETGEQTHLTIVGSNVHAFAAHQQLEAPTKGMILEDLSRPEHADMAARYFLSKLVVMQCARELAARIPSFGKGGRRPQVIVNCPSPGWCRTALFRQDDGGFWGRNMLKLIGRTAESGARVLTCAIASGQDRHGQYYSECRVKPASVYVRSEEGRQLQGAVWNELLGRITSIAPGAADGLI